MSQTFFKLFLLALAIYPLGVCAEGQDQIETLEKKFVSAEHFAQIYRHEDVPEDIRKWLFRTARSKIMANFGEVYNKTDVVDKKYPMAQHQYTLVAEDVAGTLIKVGGFAPTQWLVLIDRETDTACKWQVNWELEFKESLRYIVEHKREMHGPDRYLVSPGCRGVAGVHRDSVKK